MGHLLLGLKVVMGGSMPFLRTLLKMALEDEGIEVVADTDNVDTLLLSCTKFNPDIVVIDLGLDETQTIRLIESILDINPHIAIVTLTHAGAGFGERALYAGCRAYIEKPFSTLDLITTLTKVAPRR